MLMLVICTAMLCSAVDGAQALGTAACNTVALVSVVDILQYILHVYTVYITEFGWHRVVYVCVVSYCRWNKLWPM